ncbi:MAG: hypothetical protein ACI4TV_05920 [Paludibacteraceae bacterium]
MKKLYYIDSIITTRFIEERPHVETGESYSVRVVDVEDYQSLQDSEQDERFDRLVDTVIEVPSARMQLEGGGRLYEGMFVYYENGVFSSAHKDSAVQQLIALGRTTRTRLRNRSQGTEEYLLSEAWISDKATQVQSFHVNVGHGNCSLILWKNEGQYALWMVDCGHSNCGRRFCEKNIQAVMAHIATLVGCPSVRINRFMLTHWHLDHFCDINFLVREGWIDSKTIFVMNLYYSCSSPLAIQILSTLDKMQVLCYEPFVGMNSVGSNSVGMNVLYPQNRVVRWKNPSWNCIEEKKINNTSAVYAIKSANHIMVFPGDLEQQGFDRVTTFHGCRFDLFWCDYYCVSHHASENGHISHVCKSVGTPILQCVGTKLKYAIVMGKDGTYNGSFYSRRVLNDWSISANKVLFSEHDSNGNRVMTLVLDWNTGTYKYLY